MNLSAAFSVALVGLGAMIALGNAICWLRSRISGRFFSRVPLLGAAMAAWGLWSMPDGRVYAWVPFVADIGSLELLLALPAIVRRERRYARANRLAEFAYEDAEKRIRLTFFRDRIALLQEWRLNGSGGATGRWDGAARRIRFLPDGQPDAFLEFERSDECLECVEDAIRPVVPSSGQTLAGVRLALRQGSPDALWPQTTESDR